MSCLNDNLDQVRALTDVLATADGPIVSHAVTGASNLTPVGRCADTALLKSAMPLPKDEKTLREVATATPIDCRDSALFDLGNFTDRSSPIKGAPTRGGSHRIQTAPQRAVEHARHRGECSRRRSFN
jgi:hypothetical protein